MKIIFNGGLYGKEALCYQGREIIKQLGKNEHKINILGPKTKGFWSKYYGNFKGKEDLYVMNGHVSFIPEIVKDYKKIVHITVLECDLSADWIDALNKPEIKQIWTISEFCKKLIVDSGVTNTVKTIYLGLDKRFFKKEVNLFPKDKSFKFLNICAPHCIGTRDRKGLDVLINAFKKEFGDDPKIKLILKINTIYADKIYKKFGKQFDLNKYLLNLLPKGSNIDNIQIINEYLSTESLNDLYNSIDCGVFPSRAEGFGLPQAEMIKIGKPVITTDYSSTNEFSDPLLRIKVKGMWPLDYQNLPPYYKNRFAEPDEDHLRKLMRNIYEKDYNFKLPEIFKEFDWDKIGKRMNSYIKEI